MKEINLYLSLGVLLKLPINQCHFHPYASISANVVEVSCKAPAASKTMNCSVVFPSYYSNNFLQYFLRRHSSLPVKTQEKQFQPFPHIHAGLLAADKTRGCSVSQNGHSHFEVVQLSVVMNDTRAKGDAKQRQ